MADVAHLYSPIRRTPGRKSMGTGGLAACPWLEDDESSWLGVWRSSRHFHLLLVLALGRFSSHHKPLLQCPWRTAAAPLERPAARVCSGTAARCVARRYRAQSEQSQVAARTYLSFSTAPQTPL